MIAVTLEGRLGNQLFQYAFIYSVAKKLNTRFYIDKSVNDFILTDYFKIKKDYTYIFDKSIFSIKGFKNLFNFHLKRFFYHRLNLILKLKKKQFCGSDIHPQIILDHANNHTIYEGYFQSQLFFKNAEIELREKFIVKPKHQEEFKKRYASLYNNHRIVCVHIRRSDYLKLAHLNLGDDDLSLPLNYYKQAIAKFDGQNIHFVFISDDLNFVNQNFKEIANKTISADTEIMDFQHMLNSDSCIISNSTFSWWGAWLNNKPGKIVYAPKYFMGWRIKREVPVEIYPDEWIKIDF